MSPNLMFKVSNPIYFQWGSRIWPSFCLKSSIKEPRCYLFCPVQYVETWSLRVLAMMLSTDDLKAYSLITPESLGSFLKPKQTYLSFTPPFFFPRFTSGFTAQAFLIMRGRARRSHFDKTPIAALRFSLDTTKEPYSSTTCRSNLSLESCW